MLGIRSFPVALAALLASCSWPAVAQQCHERSRLLELLAGMYEEAPVSMAVASNGELLEVLATVDGSTWTIIVTRPDGVACLVASGEGWRDLSKGEGT